MSGSDVAGLASPNVAEILARLETDPKTGLNAGQLQERLSKYGPNALPEEKKSVLSGLLAYFWGPIPWMIEAAALMALIVGDWVILWLSHDWCCCRGRRWPLGVPGNPAAARSASTGFQEHHSKGSRLRSQGKDGYR